MTLKNLSLLFCVLCFSCHSFGISLRTGDLLLVSLPCHVCQLIESEEGAPFSHMGMIVQNQSETLILEVWLNRVILHSLENFLSRDFSEDSEIVVLRSRHQTNAAVLSKILPEFLGRSYDANFLWNNVDEQGREKLYCSELIFKVYREWLGEDFALEPKKMTFKKNWLQWEKYFQGHVPEGLLGISPVDFYHSNEFSIIENMSI